MAFFQKLVGSKKSKGVKVIPYEELEIQKELGRGTFGTVYKAKHKHHEVAGEFNFYGGNRNFTISQSKQ